MKENAGINETSSIPYERRSFRASINESWDRCIKKGLNSQGKHRVGEVPQETLACLLEKHRDMLELAHPYMKSLSMTIAKDSAVIGLSSKEGVLLHIERNAPELDELGYQRGFIHLESHMGTNVVGTCIETKKPIIIWGEEHFLKGLKGWAGFGAPIYIPGGQLGGVFFAMVPVKTAYRGLMTVMSIGADSIGRQMQLINDKEELLDLQDMMQEARDSIIEASSIISHEVRNSLTNISAYIQLLQLEKSIDKLRGDRILKEISRVNRLLDDFKLLSRHQRDNLQDHSLNEAIQFVVDMMRPKAELNNIEIIYYSCDESINIEADRNALNQVFINLMDNAIQAMEEEGGLLRIGLKKDPEDNMAIISFQDTGPGIPEDQIHQIFQIFHTTKKDGSGLGLHICKTIIKLHGGSIEVRSIEGEGATFLVRLPIVHN